MKISDLLSENFADGKHPGRKGLAKRSGVDCKQSVSKLRKVAANSSGEKQRMAHWCANMKSGRKKTEEGVENYHGLDLNLKNINNNKIEVTARVQGKDVGYVVFGKIKDNNLIAEFVSVYPKYQGQGIAKTMYNWVKEKGYNIVRSYDQTPNGEKFWNKNRGESGKVWEDRLDELSKELLRRYFPQRIAQLKQMTDQDTKLGKEKIKKASRITKQDLPRALSKIKDPRYGKQEPISENAVKDLEKDLKNPYSYDAIDHMMQTIADKHGISAKTLHNQFIKKHGKIPDSWVKDQELDERSKSQAQWDLMHAVADDPTVSMTRNIPQWVGQEFAAADIGHDRNALPVRVPKKPKKSLR